MHPYTAHKHTNMLWIFLGIVFCALFLVFSLPKSMHIPAPTGAQVSEVKVPPLPAPVDNFTVVILLALAVMALFVCWQFFRKRK